MTKENEELKKRMSGVEEMVANLIVDQQAMAKAFQERGDRHSGSLERHRADLNTARKDILRLKDNQSSIVDECSVLRTQVSRTGIFHVLFTFILSQLTLVVTVQSLTSDTTLHSLSSISSSYFVTDPQENQKRVYSNPKRSQHNARTTTDDPFRGRTRPTGYLIVQKDDRTRDPL